MYLANPKEVISKYKESLKKSKVFPFIKDVYLLGSYGKLYPEVESDMDIWLVVDKKTVTHTETLAMVANTEKEIRRAISKDLLLPNLNRHYASIFTPDEASLYHKIFDTRVATVSMKKELLDMPSWYKEIDQAVSFGEFVEHWQSARQQGLGPAWEKKWLRRIIEEERLVDDGNRTCDPKKLDQIIKQEYQDDHQKILELAQQHLEGVDPSKVVITKLLHGLMWTLEKVRWEIVNSSLDKDYFNKWRLGQYKTPGFNPREIGKLLFGCCLAKKSVSNSDKELSRYLIELTRKECLVKLDDFSAVLSTWVTTTVKDLITENQGSKSGKTIIPIMDKNKKVLVRVSFGSDQRFAITEYLAMKHLKSQEFVGYFHNKECAILKQKDYLGFKKLDSYKLGNYLSEYTNLLNTTHNHRLTSFGRLGDKHKRKKYSDYLLMRIDSLGTKDDLSLQIRKIMVDNKTVLDEEKPVLCHMDSGPRNVIGSKGTFKLIDFEHASGCSRFWDWEKMMLEVPVELHPKIIDNIGYTKPTDILVGKITRLVLILCFSEKLINQEQVKEKCQEYLSKTLKSNQINNLRLTI